MTMDHHKTGMGECTRECPDCIAVFLPLSFREILPGDHRRVETLGVVPLGAELPSVTGSLPDPAFMFVPGKILYLFRREDLAVIAPPGHRYYYPASFRYFLPYCVCLSPVLLPEEGRQLLPRDNRGAGTLPYA